jgi:hypothetical protein
VPRNDRSKGQAPKVWRERRLTSQRLVAIVLGVTGVLGVIVAVLVTEALVYHEESHAIVRAVAARPAWRAAEDGGGAQARVLA